MPRKRLAQFKPVSARQPFGLSCRGLDGSALGVSEDRRLYFVTSSHARHPRKSQHVAPGSRGLYPHDSETTKTI